MANLPPRPESPLRLPPRDDRRHAADERDRDRRSAQPMAPRYRSDRNERLPERDRAYVPRPRVDTYAPPYEGRRDHDRRDYDDRDRDRNRRDFDRDRDRDRRNWERERDRERDRDRDRSPPRRWSPDRDRDRRPYDRDRGPARRPVSPPRRSGPRRDSRSPPRRRFSRSPSYRGRNRTRSRSRGPYRSPPPHRSPPQRGIRLGNHSIAASPRSRSSRSPHRRRYSRDRSPFSPNRRSNQRPQSPLRDEQKPLPTEPLADRRKEESMNTTLDAQPTSPVKIEEPSSVTVASPLPQIPILDQTEQMSTGQDSTKGPGEIKSESKPESLPVVLPELPKSQSEASQQPIAPPTIMVPPETADVKMDVDSPKPPTLTSTQSRGSTPPKPSPIASDQNRGPPTGPRWGPPRSPPRGPRSHLHPRPPPLPQSSSSYQSTPRGPRREYRGPPYQSSTPKPGPPLPVIPQYRRPAASDLEQEITRLQIQRANLGVEHFQHVNSARRALQELDMASIDLQAAENRRRTADMQLEKAKTGSLGIDAPLTDFNGI